MSRNIEIITEAGAFLIQIDGAPAFTPQKRPLAAPTAALAQAIAAEWRAQPEKPNPATMPLTKLAAVAIDLTPAKRPELLAQIAQYAQTDLLCHRAETPAALAAAQAAAWDPWLAFAAAELNAPLICAPGIVAQDQPAAAIAKLVAAADALDDWRLTGLAHAMGLMGSIVLAFALARRRLDAAEAFAAAFLDDLWQLDRWGEDAEARARLERMRLELTALEAWFTSLA